MDKLCVRKTTRGKVQISLVLLAEREREWMPDAETSCEVRRKSSNRKDREGWEDRASVCDLCVIFVFSGKGVNGATSSYASGIRDRFPFVHGQCSPLHYPQNSKRKDQKNARIRILTHRLSALSLSILLATRVSRVCATE